MARTDELAVLRKFVITVRRLVTNVELPGAGVAPALISDSAVGL